MSDKGPELTESPMEVKLPSGPHWNRYRLIEKAKSEREAKEKKGQQKNNSSLSRIGESLTPQLNTKQQTPNKSTNSKP
jgi:hypothetical protein